MEKALLILALFLISCSEVEVKPDNIDPYVGDPVSEAAKERGILIDTTK